MIIGSFIITINIILSLMMLSFGGEGDKFNFLGFL